VGDGLPFCTEGQQTKALTSQNQLHTWTFMTNRFFAVTGMHRSGTSYVARIINVLGVDLGPEDAMLPAQKDNAKGFWENRQVFEVHNALLAHFGGEWDRPPLLEDGWEQSPDLGEVRERAVDVANSVYGGSAVAGWKDPRGSLLLPFWRTVVDISGTVLCLRHPAEVAASLKKRDDLDPEWSAYLWLRYTVAAYRSDPGHLLVLYDDQLRSLAGVVERLSGFLGLQRPDEQAMTSVREEFDPSLRHHYDVEVPKGPMMERAVALFELLSAETSPGTEQVIESVHESWVLANRLERSLEARMFQLWNEMRADYPDIEFPYARDHDALDGGPASFEARRPFSPSQELPAPAEARRLFGRIGTALADRLELAEQVAERGRLRERLAEIRAERDRLAGELSQQVTERDRLAGALANRVAESDRLRNEVTNRVAEGDRLRDEVAEWMGESSRLQIEAGNLQRQLAEMRASTSWRLTAPMRSVGDWLLQIASVRRRS